MPINRKGDNGLAFDSARSYDADGRMHIARSHISKATVNPYYGREIPGYESLGLKPDTIYYLLRHPDELAKAAPSFARLPILAKHQPITDPEMLPKELIVGTIGTEVFYDAPYLDADLCFWDADAIGGIETDAWRELSAAYRYIPVMTSGTYEGQHYDGIMTNIIGNHLALVESGRAGSDVLAADEAINTMKTTKLGKALFVTLGGLSPKLAQDSALLALVGKASKKTINKDELNGKLIAMDSELDPKKTASVIDALLAMDAEEKDEKKKVAEDSDDDDFDGAEDEDDEEDEKKKKKIAEDADKSDEKVKTAMDSFKKELRDADEARRAVRPVVGDVIAQDSAAEIYAFALDHMKVPHDGVKDPAALKAIFHVANTKSAAPSTSVIAQDAAGLAQRFPNAARFRQA